VKIPRVIAPLLLVALMSACNSEASPPLRPDIVIASDLPSGRPDLASLQRAIQFAVDQSPTIDGLRLGYMPFDDSIGGAAFPEKGLQNLKSMIAYPPVLGVVAGFNSYIALEEIPRASDASLVMLSPTSTNTCLTAPPRFCDADIAAAHANASNVFFRIAAPDELQGRAMGRFASQRSIKRVAIINQWRPPAQPDGDAMIAEFKRELSAGGGEVVVTQEAPRPTHDFIKFLADAKQANADAIYALGDGGGGMCDLRAQMRSDFKYLLLTDGETEDDDCVSQNGPVPMTFGTISGFNPDIAKVRPMPDVVKAFVTAYPKAEINDYTFAAYDCARILIAAVQRAMSDNGGSVPTRQEVLKEVAKGEFAGLTGTYSFLPTGDARSPLMSVWAVENNKWTYLHQEDVTATAQT
jgi:branched-chain amino acid transport system substrate-binding protein